jgi:hypothetical protein
MLSMRIVGESENYGTEQERLNNVFGRGCTLRPWRATKGQGWNFSSICRQEADGHIRQTKEPMT